MSSFDRTKRTPFLTRVFWCHGGHNETTLYDELKTPMDSPEYEGDEVHLYVWMNTTMRELACKVRAALGSRVEAGVRLALSRVYVTHEGKAGMTELATVQTLKRGKDDNRTLKQCRLRQGDIIDVAVHALE